MVFLGQIVAEYEAVHRERSDPAIADWCGRLVKDVNARLPKEQEGSAFAFREGRPLCRPLDPHFSRPREKCARSADPAAAGLGLTATAVPPKAFRVRPGKAASVRLQRF